MTEFHVLEHLYCRSTIKSFTFLRFVLICVLLQCTHESLVLQPCDGSMDLTLFSLDTFISKRPVCVLKGGKKKVKFIQGWQSAFALHPVASCETSFSANTFHFASEVLLLEQMFSGRAFSKSCFMSWGWAWVHKLFLWTQKMGCSSYIKPLPYWKLLNLRINKISFVNVQ